MRYIGLQSVTLRQIRCGPIGQQTLVRGCILFVIQINRASVAAPALPPQKVVAAKKADSTTKKSRLLVLRFRVDRMHPPPSRDSGLFGTLYFQDHDIKPSPERKYRDMRRGMVHGGGGPHRGDGAAAVRG
jgi:hypothetical protein